MAFSLSGHTALVTGSTTGLGKGIAQAFGQAGAKVAVNYYHNSTRAEKTVAEFQELGITCDLFKANVIDESSVNNMFDEIEEKLGAIDILVPNATPDQPLKPIEEYDWDFYQSMLDFFVKSPYLLTRRALPNMKQAKWGRIINITSEVFQLSVAPFSAYVAAKGGQVGWSRSMAKELAAYGITVNMIAPGWIPTERHDSDPQAMKDGYLAAVPMKRWGTPADVAAAAVYFASKEAGFVTGQTICVNGGNSPC